MNLQSLKTNFKILFILCFLACASTSEIKNTPLDQGYKFEASFELKSDSIWKVPGQGQGREIYLALEMTNLGKESVRFPIMDKFSISLQNSDGDELLMEGGQDVLIPGKPISDPVPSGGKYLLQLSCQLLLGTDDQLQLSIKDKLGSIWWIGPLNTGSYFLKMDYGNQRTDGKNSGNLWSGQADITPVPIQIAN